MPPFCSASWALVFQLDPNDPDDIPEEAIEIVDLLFAAGLHVEDFVSRDHDELFVLVNSDDDVMIREATDHVQIPMRLKGLSGTIPFHEDLVQHFRHDHPGSSVFNSGQRQQIIMSIMKRRCHLELKSLVNATAREVLLQKAKDKCGGAQPLPKRATQIKQLLLAYGAFRAEALTELHFCAEMCEYVLERPVSWCPPDKVMKCVDELERWGKEHDEQLQGTLRSFFPLHDRDELQPLKEQWGTFGILWVRDENLKVKKPGYPKFRYTDAHDEAQSTWFDQPLDEVRDYFGDHVGLYFAWLGLYTRSLVWPALLGCLAMFGQIQYGVDKNPMLTGYSIFLAMWSVWFIESWKRRECELRFIWGSDGSEEKEDNRMEFKGEPELNPDTNEEELRQKPLSVRIRTFILSFLTIAVLIFATIFSAFAAMLIRVLHQYRDGPDLLLNETIAYNVSVNTTMQCCVNTVPACDVACVNASGYGEFGRLPANSTTVNVTNITLINVTTTMLVEGLKASLWDKNKYKMLSSFVNFLIIQGFGNAYEKIARTLNNLENHRTETDYTDALIVKNFSFQFVNNYFIMFYIAFLKQVKIRDDWYEECKGSSCMNEMQYQLMIVFTFKTFGLQIVEIGGPFLKTWLAIRQENKTVAKGEDSDAGELTMQMTTAEFKEKYPYEYESKKLEYEGTFDDFNEMTIQFGYVLLFAAPFPLAPLFALLNNVTEIRGDSLKLCTAFKRSEWQQAEDIGSWATVLNFISTMGVVTNAALIGFVSSAQAASEVEEGGIEARLQSYRLWITVVVIEHAVLIARTALQTFYPTEPHWVERAQETLTFHQTNDLRTNEQMRRDAEHALQDSLKSNTEGHILLNRHKPKDTAAETKAKKARKAHKAAAAPVIDDDEALDNNDLVDDALETAAVQIQSVFRGSKARMKMVTDFSSGVFDDTLKAAGAVVNEVDAVVKSVNPLAAVGKRRSTDSRKDL